MIRRLYLILGACVLALSLVFPSSGLAMQGVSGTFFQPTNAMKSWDDATWDTLFATYQRLGICEIIVQWVVFEEGGPDPEITPESAGAQDAADTKQAVVHDLSVIEKVLSYAECYGMHVTIGGFFINSYWTRLNTEPEILQVHLMRVRRETVKVIEQLAPRLTCSPAFAGWYLSQEIDDRTWLGKQRSAILCTFIKDMYRELDALVPNRPMSISAFSNGWASPQTLGEFWRTVADETGIVRVLFQDGVGVKKLAVAEAPIYLNALQQEMAGACCAIQPVVEIFTQLEGDAFKAEPASLKRIKAQMREELPFAPNGVMLFSVAEYMSPIGGEKAEALLHKVLAEK